LIFSGLTLLFAGWANLRVSQAGENRVFTESENACQAQAVLILGALVYPDGRLSDILLDRTITALEAYQAGRAEKILISGDHGRRGYDEVGAVRDYLLEQGVPPEDIFTDHAGFDTRDSLYRAREIFQADSLIIVTQNFHLPRALFLADDVGIQACGLSADRHIYATARLNAIREPLAIVKAYWEALWNTKPTYLGDPIPITGNGQTSWD
jgi:SanA protein